MLGISRAFNKYVLYLKSDSAISHLQEQGCANGQIGSPVLIVRAVVAAFLFPSSLGCMKDQCDLDHSSLLPSLSLRVFHVTCHTLVCRSSLQLPSCRRRQSDGRIGRQTLYYLRERRGEDRGREYPHLYRVARPQWLSLAHCLKWEDM